MTWKLVYVSELSSLLHILGCCWNGEWASKEQEIMNACVLTWGYSCPCTTPNGSISRVSALLPNPQHLHSASGSTSDSFKRKYEYILLIILHGCSVLWKYCVWSYTCCPSSGFAHCLQTLSLPPERMPSSVFSLDPVVLLCCLFMKDTCSVCLMEHCVPLTGLPEGCGVEAAARDQGEDLTSSQA